MTIKYNNKVIAGKYREQVIPFANTVDAGIAKIATQEQINEGTDNTSIVTPVYLAQKQDKLTAGEGIDIDATNTISSKVLPDKVTIVENDNKTLSTVARKTINEKLVFDWEGTEAEYHQAIMNGEIDPDWYCYITDDELSVSYNDVLSRTLVNIAPDGIKVLGASNAYLTNDVYIDEAGYNQLLELKNSATQNGVDNITVNETLVAIPYVLAHTGSKITDAQYREVLTEFYNENGYTSYFTIDEENKNYTLPMGEIYGKLVDRDLSDISEIAKDIIKDIAGVSFGLFDTKIADHELSLEESMGWALQGTYVYKEAITGERFGYPTFYERCVQEKNAGTAKSVTLGSSTITMYVNDNGHQFYNIADKSIVDTYYTSFGIADFYGIDEENECIFLPRNKWFVQLTDDTANVNKFTDAGLPNITGEYSNTSRAELYPANNMTFKGALQRGASNKNTVSTANNYTGYGFKFDASRSNATYGKSTTVQPKSSSKLLYYCVGNTKADTSWVNVFAQVEEGIKEIYDTKAEVLEEVNTLRDTTVTELDTFKSNSINDIEELRVESVNELETLRDTSVNELETLSTNNIGLIENSTNQGLSQINVLKNTSVDEIGTLRQDSVDEIGTLHANSINEIDTLRNSSVSELERKRVSSNESIITTKEESITEILDTTEDRIQEAKSWAVGTEKENPQGSAKYWAEVAELSSSNALFDTKVSDHILKDAEAYGWALQGTYVYSEAIFGEHLGYPDFYNKCIAEYTNPTNEKLYLSSNINTVGSLTNNNGVLSGFSVDNYGVMPKYPTGINSFDIQFKFTTGNSLDTSATIFGQYVTNMSTPQFGTIENGEVYFIASADGTAWSAGISTKVNPNQVYILNINWDGSKISGTLTDELGNTTKMGLYDVYSDELTSLNWTNLVKIGCDATTNPFNGSIDLNECYININGERWWNGVNYITKNSNGHKFYSIIDKAIIDNVYNQNGIADFYGIDEVNQRILLPRNKYFHQLTLDTNEVNNMVEAGLPNITGTFALGDVADAYTAYTNHLQYGDGAFYSNTQSTASYNEGGQSTKGNIPKFDASRSNSIYGKSNTVQPQSSLKLLYYCVGNTKADTSWIKLVEQVENGIKDIEDKRVESIKDVDTLRENSIDEILSTKQNYLDELEDKRVSSNNSIEETKDNSIQELVNTSEDLIEETRIWAIGTEEEKPEGSAKYWAKVAELSSSNAIFDTKVSDHILDEAEAHGWTLCGTKAYKEAVIGEHLGYPTFYETCLNEYEQSEIIDRLYSCNVATTGTLTNNDGVVNGFSASNYMTLPDIMPSVENWEYNLKIKFSDISATQYAINVGKSGAYNFLFGLNSGKFTVWISSNNTSWDIASDIKGSFATVANTYYYIKYGFNGNEYYLEYSTTGEENSYTRDITIASTTKIYQPTTTPNIGYGWTSSPANNTFIDLNESFININGERWWTGTTRFNTYRYKNGHEYYLEKNKQFVDEIVKIHTNNMYGINLEEQSVIIPHINRTLIESKQPSGTDSSWYNLYSDGWCEQGGRNSVPYKGAVVNLLKEFKDTSYSIHVTCSTNTGNDNATINAFGIATSTKTITLGSGYSPNTLVYWQASGYTNLPNTKLTYTYMCTGNTKADTSWVNIVEQVAEGAKEIYDTKENVLQEIDKLRQGSVDEIDTLRQDSTSEVDTLRQNSLQEMEDKRVASNESITTTKEESIEELVETSHDLINESRKWAIGTQEENEQGSAKYWSEVAELHSSNALFDTKTSDHVLKDAEAYGWELQGNWVYKNAILGEHLGYPTFYEKCIEEYKNSTDIFFIPNIDIVGSPTNNNGVFSNLTNANYIKTNKNINLGTANTWEIVTKHNISKVGSANDGFMGILGGAYNVNYYISASNKITIELSSNGTSYNIGSISMKNAVTLNVDFYIKAEFTGTSYNLYYGTDKNDLQLQGTISSSVKVGSRSNRFAFGVDEAGNHSNWVGSIDLNESYININDKRFWYCGHVYKNQNGHLFYNISDKSSIDSFYSKHGIAWFYGIDEENERIFLPRNDWFEHLTGDLNEVNEMVEAGLPNIEGYFDITRAAPQNGTGAFSTVVTGGWGEGDNVTTGGGNVTLNASKSNPIYGNSDTVQPPASKKLLYICVGNTKADTSWMKLTEQVEEGIKEIYDEKVKSLEEVDTLRINSINEIDTLKANSIEEIDTLRQNSVQEITDTKNTSLEEIDTLKQNSTTDIDNLRVDSLNQINTLTDESIEEINTLHSNSVQEITNTKQSSLDELEAKRVSSNESIITTKEESIEEINTTSADLIDQARKWAVGTSDENKQGSAKFWAETAQLSSSNALFDTKVSDHVLEGSELYGWALQGTYVYKEAVLGEHLGYPTFYEKCLEEKENATSTNITLGSNTVAIYINNNGHQFYDITDKEAVDSFYSTYGVADYYGIDTENERIFLPRNIKEKRYLVESKKATSSDSTWYNLYSDGWLEQGGIVASGSNSNTVTLPKSFKDTSYSVQLTNSKTATIANYAPVSNITANNTFVVYSNGDGCKGCNKYWVASGYTDSIDIKDKFIYYCVGNTKADTSWINLVEQVQESVKEIYDEKVKSLEEIDTLRQDSVNEVDVLKANSVQEIIDTKNNSLKEVDDTTLRGLQSLAGASNALTHNQVTNCLLEIPQRIKYTLEDGTLTILAGSVVIVPYGVEDLTAQYPIGATFLHENFKVADIQFTDGKLFVWVKLVSDLVFNMPLENEGNRQIFLNLSQNILHRAVVINSNITFDEQANIITYDEQMFSLPLMLTTQDSTGVKLVYQVFNGFGYIGSTVWVDKGVKGLVPNGRNVDGTLNNIEFETQTVLTRTITNTADIDCTIAIDSNRLYLYAKSDDRYYDEEQNYIIHSDTKMSFAYVGEYHSNNCVISDFKPKSTFRAIDYNDITNILSSGGGSTVSIVDSYEDGDSGYIVYSDGYCRQWGKVNFKNKRVNNLSVSYYKKLKNNFVVPFVYTVVSGTLKATTTIYGTTTNTYKLNNFTTLMSFSDGTYTSPNTIPMGSIYKLQTDKFILDTAYYNYSDSLGKSEYTINSAMLYWRTECYLADGEY